MSTEKKLMALFEVVIQECKRNKDFSSVVEDALNELTSKLDNASSKNNRRHRRTPAVLDPVTICFEKGEDVLHNRLNELDLEKLRDILAEYGMDPGKLVMKWKNKEKVIKHIIDTSDARAKKGEAFR